MRPNYWNDTRCGDNVVRVRNFHSAPHMLDQRRRNALIIILPLPRVAIERPCDCGEPEELRERAPP